MNKFAFLACLLGLGATASVRADSVIYDNSTASSFTITALDVGPQGNALYSDDNFFTLSSSASIDEIMVGIWVQTGSNLTSLTGGIYTSPFGGGTEEASFSGAPNSSTLVVSGFDFDSYNLYEEYFDISSVALGAGTYYLALSTGTTDEGGQLAWDQSSNSNTSADEWVSVDSTIQNEYSNLSSTTFTLYGTGGAATPEPSSLLLLGSGLGALAIAMWRRAKV